MDGDLISGQNEWKHWTKALPLSLPPVEKLEKESDDFIISRNS